MGGRDREDTPPPTQRRHDKGREYEKGVVGMGNEWMTGSGLMEIYDTTERGIPCFVPDDDGARFFFSRIMVTDFGLEQHRNVSPYNPSWLPCVL